MFWLMLVSFFANKFCKLVVSLGAKTPTQSIPLKLPTALSRQPSIFSGRLLLQSMEAADKSLTWASLSGQLGGGFPPIAFVGFYLHVCECRMGIPSAAFATLEFFSVSF
jgi:hypothetical protein